MKDPEKDQAKSSACTEMMIPSLLISLNALSFCVYEAGKMRLPVYFSPPRSFAA